MSVSPAGGHKAIAIESETEATRKRRLVKPEKLRGALKPDGTDLVRERFVQLRNVITQKGHISIESKALNFTYKERRVDGSDIHIAALAVDGCADGNTDLDLLVKALLHAYGGVSNPMSLETKPFVARITDSKGSGEISIVHLAAGIGNLAFLKTLLSQIAQEHHEVILDSKTKWDGAPHYTALHEAAFYCNTDIVSFLIERGVHVQALNKDAMTALHVAAKQGYTRIIKLLVNADDSNTIVASRDDNGETALDVAVNSGHLNLRHLHYLMNKDNVLDDLISLAKRCPVAASLVMRDKHNRLMAEAWSKRLNTLQLDTEKWLLLLQLAPRAAKDVLALTLTEPEVSNSSHYPLPLRVLMKRSQLFVCSYQQTKCWSTEDQAQGWHQHLCKGYVSWKKRAAGGGGEGGGAGVEGPRSSMRRPSIVSVRPLQQIKSISKIEEDLSSKALADRRYEHTTVKVKILQMPGILTAEVLLALASVKEQAFFAELAAQAIIEHSWNSVVWAPYWHELWYKFSLLVVLGISVLHHPSEDLSRKMIWSWLAVACVRTFFYKLNEFYFHGICNPCWRRLNSSKKGTQREVQLRAMLRKRNLWELASAWLLAVLLVNCQETLRLDQEGNGGFLAALAISSWLDLAWSLRAFTWAGPMILPIMLASAQPMVGILVVLCFAFAGFLHAFLALDLTPDNTTDHFDLIQNAARFMIIGDDSAADVLLKLGNSKGDWLTFSFLMLTAVVFCTIILNLFIAVHGSAYDLALENVHISFLRERASICFKYMIRPSLPASAMRVSWPKATAIVIYAIAACAWGATLHFAPHPIWASLALLPFQLVVDSVLTQREWASSEKNEKEEGQRYLWICHRDNYDENLFCSDCEEMLLGNLGTVGSRLQSLKQATAQNNQKLIQMFEDKIEESSQQREDSKEDAVKQLQRHVSELKAEQQSQLQQHQKSLGDIMTQLADIKQQLEQRHTDSPAPEVTQKLVTQKLERTSNLEPPAREIVACKRWTRLSLCLLYESSWSSSSPESDSKGQRREPEAAAEPEVEPLEQSGLWERVWHEPSGRYFYWKVNTDIAVPMPEQESDGRKPSPEEQGQSSGGATQVVGPSPRQLPDGWERCWDESQNAYYYWNRTNNATQWDMPAIPELLD